MKNDSFEYIAIADVEMQVLGEIRITGTASVTDLGRRKMAELTDDTQRVFVAIRHKENGKIEFVMLKRPGDSKVDCENPLSNCTAETLFKANSGTSTCVVKDESDGTSYFEIENISDFKLLQFYKRKLNIKVLDTSGWKTKGGWDGKDMSKLLK
ncbi:MAG: hypothetical protein ACI8RD_007361 [Bacillariaceae sp.]